MEVRICWITFKHSPTAPRKYRAGLVKPEEDDILCVMNDGRKAALDISLVQPASPNAPMPKVDALVERWRRFFTTAPVQGTQLIFCDLATPKAKSKVGICPTN